MVSDDQRRSAHGIVVSLLDTDDDSVRITLDDVENDSGRPDTWSHRVFVTSKTYDKAVLEDLDLPEEDYAALGHYVFARLIAIRNNS